MEIRLYAWQAKAIIRFGLDPNGWKFQCPACHLVQSVADFLDLGMGQQQAHRIAGYSCIRRWHDQSCMHSGGGPVQLLISPGEIRPTFEFAP